jgi:hypothetical protein
MISFEKSNIETDAWIHEYVMDKHVKRIDMGDQIIYNDLPCYTENVAAAWPIIDHFLSFVGYGFEMRTTSLGNTKASFKPDNANFTAYAKSVPLAICKAAHIIISTDADYTKAKKHELLNDT